MPPSASPLRIATGLTLLLAFLSIFAGAQRLDLVDSWLRLPTAFAQAPGDPGSAGDPSNPQDPNEQDPDAQGPDAQDPNRPPGSPEADSAEESWEARLPVKVIGGRLVVRCEVSTRARRLPANLFVDFNRLCGLELHNRAADALRVDSNGGLPISIRFPGHNLVEAGREHGDEEAFEAFTRLYSRELGETAILGTIGAKLLEKYHVVFDLNAGFIFVRPPQPVASGPPERVDNTTLTSLTLVNDLAWFPVRLADDRVLSLAVGSSRYDSTLDTNLAWDLDRPAGDIGAVKVGTLDLSKYLAFRPVELVQVHPDGALGVTGINLLEHFRVEIDRVNRFVRFTETRAAAFPEADLSFFRTLGIDDPEPLLAYLDEYPGSRLAREAAERLLALQLEFEAEAEEFATALEWIDKTRIDDLRTTEALASMKVLVSALRPEVAIMAGEIGVEHGRKDRYPESVHKLHLELGRLLLEQDEDRRAWEHLLSAAFGLPDDGHVNLELGRFYERSERYRRAMSRYLQAVITPETGALAVAGLERVQNKIGGERFSVDLIDKLIAGKVHNYTAANPFEETPETQTNRVVLAELYTNPHFGRKLTEGWRSFAVGGAMAAEGLLTHYPRSRLAVLSYHIDAPEPNALINPLSLHMAQRYRIDRPVYFRINGVRNGPGAARWRQAEEAYNENRVLVMEELADSTRYLVSLNVTLDKDLDTLRGTVTARGPERSGLRVQIVLAERGVLYPGKAKVVVHRNVVRGALTESLDGELFAPDEDGKQRVQFTSSIKQLQRTNEEFLEQYERDGRGLTTRLSTEIDPLQLTVVALIREVDSGEVLQAVQVDVESPLKEEVR